MNLLIVNDDGISSPSLYALAAAFSRGHVVTVVAPDGNRSAVGHGITLHAPIFAHRVDYLTGVAAWSVSGTPADCTRLGLLNLAPGPVDLVLSGPNRGYNAASDLLYSGTVAAALEAAMLGVKAIALSTTPGADDHQTIQNFVSVFGLLDLEKDFDQVLNINLPDLPLTQIKGLRWAALGDNRWQGNYEQRTTESGVPAFYPPSRPPQVIPGGADDWNSLNDGYITLTPLGYHLEQSIEGRRAIPWQ